MARKRAQPLTTEIAKLDGEDKPAPKLELVAIPAALLLAAETIVAKAPKDRTDLQGVLLHQKDTGIARVVAADGFRIFIGSFEAKPAASWLKGGIMVSREDLKPRVNMLLKVAESPIVVLAFAKGESRATLMDIHNTMSFKIDCAEVKELPDYEANIQMKTFTDLTDDAGRTMRPEWEPVGFNSRHMKDVGDIARILEGGMDKRVREKNGMTIRVFDQGNINAPRIFDFQGWDGAILIVGAMALPTAQFPLLTAKVLAPAVKGTIAALRAHATRWTDAAAQAESEEARAACLAKAESFQQRVNAVLARAPEKAIAGPAAPAEKLEAPAEADAATGEDGASPVDLPATAAEKAAVTRKKRAAARAAKATMH
jgi:hypothetical protein